MSDDLFVVLLVIAGVVVFVLVGKKSPTVEQIISQQMTPGSGSPQDALGDTDQLTSQGYLDN